MPVLRPGSVLDTSFLAAVHHRRLRRRSDSRHRRQRHLVVRCVSPPTRTGRDAGAVVSGDQMNPGGGLFGRLSQRLGEDDAGAVDEAGDTGPTFSMSDLVDLPDDERSLARLVLRSDGPQQLDDLAAALGWSRETLERCADALQTRGALEIVSGTLRPASSWRTRRPAPGGIWSRLGQL
jgi:hypothetical protein